MNIEKLRALKDQMDTVEMAAIQEAEKVLEALIAEKDKEIEDFFENSIKDYSPGFIISLSFKDLVLTAKNTGDQLCLPHNITYLSARMKQRLDEKAKELFAGNEILWYNGNGEYQF